MRAALAAGLALVGLLAAAALASLVWLPHDPDAIDVAHRFAGASLGHPLGLDQLGRDVLARLMVGARVSLAASLLAVATGFLLGAPAGIWAASGRGSADELASRGADIVFAFPSLLTAVLLAAAWGPGLADAVAAIAIFNVPVAFRVARAAARPVWRQDYVAAARLAGRGRAAIGWAHVLPAVAAPLLVQATIQVALALLAEAGLSYLGLGVQPPVPSWGRMLADAQTLLGVAPRLALVPGIAIALAVLGFTLAGDGLAEWLRTRR